LGAREIKESQCDRTRSVGDSAEQRPAAAVNDFGELDPALGEHLLART
jgi:hypothetical protein